jgi:hypothetical protein
MEAQEKIRAVLITWNASNEVSISIFLFLPIPSLVIVRIMMCARGRSGCDGRCARVAFLALSLVERGRNGGRCWWEAREGILLLSNEGPNKFVIGS